MLLEAKSVLGLPVATLEEKQKIGTIKKIFVDRKNAKVLGFLIHVEGFIFGRNLFLSESDILDIDKNGVVTRTKENFIDPKEVMRVKRILTEHFSLFGLSATTRSEKRLGKISNFVINTNTLQVVKFYIRGLFENRIVDYKKVYKITKKQIIFKNDIDPIKIKKTTGKILAVD